ncbi:hypothetical protein, partial [Salmonella enterica]|uniref:hypothetical protein n=1 Tax=Salmonella enterica TaxID=28901 RepID=UPI001E59659F
IKVVVLPYFSQTASRTASGYEKTSAFESLKFGSILLFFTFLWVDVPFLVIGFCLSYHKAE